ncbi:MAG: hypothetical protein U0L93_08650, partial [Bacteroidales bacterium]|nr:hypothetical protein [Bacteroidales bacterium]
HIEEMRLHEDVLYNDYFVGNKSNPTISVSAIVGENGAGKSSVIEFYIRMINNFAAATIGEYEVNPGAQHLHFIDGIRGELYYMINTTPYKLKIENRNVALSSYSQRAKMVDRPIVVYIPYNTEDIFNNELSVNPYEENELYPIEAYRSKKIRNRQVQNNLAELYKHFFYTFVSNFSSYAYNTNDFANECNSDRYEELIRKSKKKRYTIEQKNWLNGIFHKNDGYQTPIVLAPFRNEGNIDINTENLLARERLLSLIIAPNSEFRTINGHLNITGFKLNLKNKKYDIKYLKQNIGFSRLQQKGYDDFRESIIKYWSDCISIDLLQYRNRKFYDEAIGYLVCKTLKISKTYRQYNKFYRDHYGISFKINHDVLYDLIKRLYLDKSHITKKIRQILGYIVYGIYDDITNENSIIDIAKIQTKNVFSQKSSFIYSIDDLVPPPIFDVNICLRNNETGDDVQFETLSSGERQQVYSISSLLYHLSNINSVWFDTNGQRVVYDHLNVILEEIELYFHPELQRTYLKRLFDGIKQVDIPNIKSLNICFVTHSPFVLSDIPARNILALKKDTRDTEKISLSTFGANIHEMLKNSFFLKNGSIGDYASWVITQIIESLQNVADKKEIINTDVELHNKIMLIDEPIIRNVLLREYHKFYPLNSKEQEIAELKKKLAELENSK